MFRQALIVASVALVGLFAGVAGCVSQPQHQDSKTGDAARSEQRVVVNVFPARVDDVDQGEAPAATPAATQPAAATPAKAKGAVAGNVITVTTTAHQGTRTDGTTSGTQQGGSPGPITQNPTIAPQTSVQLPGSVKAGGGQ